MDKMGNYMGMTDSQNKLHANMMSKPMNEYPKPLILRLKSLDSICGEVIAEEVAKYIMSNKPNCESIENCSEYTYCVGCPAQTNPQKN